MASRLSGAAVMLAAAMLPALAGCGSSPISPTIPSTAVSSPPPAAANPPVLVTLSGVVTETAPTQTVKVSGVRVHVVGGASTTTDAEGHFSMPGLAGVIDVELSREGYFTRTVQVTVPADQSAVTLQIGPPPDTVTESDGNGGLFSGNSITAPMHNSGEVVITDVGFYGFEEGDGMTFQIVRDGVVVAETFLERSFPRHTVALRAFVEGGHMIQVRTATFSHWTTLTFTHPR